MGVVLCFSLCGRFVSFRFVFSFLFFQDYGMDSFNLGETLAGTVQFSGITMPIVSANVRTTFQFLF